MRLRTGTSEDSNAAAERTAMAVTGVTVLRVLVPGGLDSRFSVTGAIAAVRLRRVCGQEQPREKMPAASSRYLI
ncbi:hypothetical protein [Phaeobacter gallaeciensis]|uniref:hypothetical protein n=2 Tax=Phaeobacter gallaeciensis TaxID=60890 RepID=UPI00237FC97E|nr:hypothetical protein [Phaeobacter gallaeciensis]MDE4099704.1 hypothetical protein [Phaeobacter gallaeciensis]MDE4108561.1 hypothetical protein [Phaeobacter gallaeciensis]MDE4117345.1 hypothetical protein [Phaeobacter gallaeciensis]MDE4121818.1 hypothetical protein [Phaeobacter gallaeciensis]